MSTGSESTDSRAADAAPEHHPQQTLSNYRWVVISVWLVAGTAAFMVMSTLGILLPAISMPDEFGLSPSRQGLLGSSAFWGAFGLGIPLSWWASRFAPKGLTTLTLIGAVLCLLLQGWAPTFAFLLAGRLMFGLAILARDASRALLIHQWFPQREIILVNSVSNALYGLIVGGGLLATPFILSAVGNNWRMVFHIFAGLFGVLTASWMWLGKERVPHREFTKLGPWATSVSLRALTYKDLWLAGFGFMGSTLAMAAFLSFLPTFLLDTYEISLEWSGAVLSVTTFVGGVAGIGIGYLAMVTNWRNPMLQALGIVMAGSFVGMTLTGSIPLLMFLSFLNGIAWGFWPLLGSVPFQLPGIKPREMAVGLAVMTSGTAMGVVLGPLIAGFIQEAADLKPALVIVSFAGLSVSIAGLFLRVGRAEATSGPELYPGR